MKNEEAWAYVKKVADWFGAIDSESVAQDALLQRWDMDLPTGYWAACGRNGARNQYRKETQQIRLRDRKLSGVYNEAFDTNLMLEYIRENHPDIIRDLAMYEPLEKQHAGAERTRVSRARQKLAALFA